jgi:hypothetical protein
MGSSISNILLNLFYIMAQESTLPIRRNYRITIMFALIMIVFIAFPSATKSHHVVHKNQQLND